ncbi:MAG: hypothetical protein JST49_06220, partial [Bacteroidetes bacterium]|nr:hypothetical protein [Bacteroidota bacterium]
MTKYYPILLFSFLLFTGFSNVAKNQTDCEKNNTGSIRFINDTDSDIYIHLTNSPWNTDVTITFIIKASKAKQIDDLDVKAVPNSPQVQQWSWAATLDRPANKIP